MTQKEPFMLNSISIKFLMLLWPDPKSFLSSQRTLRLERSGCEPWFSSLLLNCYCKEPELHEYYSNTQLLITDHHSPFTIHHLLFTTHHSPFTIHHLLFTIYCSPFTIHHSLFTIHYSPFTIHHSPFTIYHSPFTIHYSPLTTHHSKFHNYLTFLTDSIVRYMKTVQFWTK